MKNLAVLEFLSSKLTNQIGTLLPEKSKTELEQIEYGIHILLINIIKLPIIFIIAYFLGIFKYTLTAFLSFSFLRSFASGLHARNGLTCFLSTSIIYLGTAYSGSLIKLTPIGISIMFTICLILTYLYAPADTEEKPIISKKRRGKLKTLSCLAVIALYIISLLIVKTQYACIITFATLAETISILPLTYIISKRRYNNYEIFSN